jgi:hypothetical protein
VPRIGEPLIYEISWEEKMNIYVPDPPTETALDKIAHTLEEWRQTHDNYMYDLQLQMRGIREQLEKLNEKFEIPTEFLR